MSKILTEEEKLDLSNILHAFRVPDNVIEFVLSPAGKAHVLNKYLLRREDFVLKTHLGVYKLPFSAVRITEGAQALEGLLKKPNALVNKSSEELLKKSDVSDNQEPLKKGRGKGKKPVVSRSSMTCLVDVSDIEKLEKLALSQDVSVSHLVRLAIKLYLKKS